MGRVFTPDRQLPMGNTFLLVASLCQAPFLKVAGLGLAKLKRRPMGGRHPPDGPLCSGCGCGRGRWASTWPTTQQGT